jgi:sulfoxide reductase heme-binding subunit YedZ
VNEAAGAARVARRTSALAVACAAALGLGLVAWLAARASWAVAQTLLFTRGSGWLALSALLLSLSCTPAGRIFARFGFSRMPAVAVLRRALGMGAAWLALLHAATALARTLHWNWAATWHWPHLRAGLTALAVLVVLLATSFNAVIARLRLTFFKELHRLAYVAALLALQHVLLSPFAARGLALALFAGVFLLGFARFLRPPGPPPV